MAIGTGTSAVGIAGARCVVCVSVCVCAYFGNSGSSSGKAAGESLYQIGVVTALAKERLAVQLMFDEKLFQPSAIPGDNNIYAAGRIGAHNVVLASLPTGETGEQSAARVVTSMKMRFPGMKQLFLVGTAGCAPYPLDIRLGDVVIGTGKRCLVHYDHGKMLSGGELELTDHLRPPSQLLVNAVDAMVVRQQLEPLVRVCALCIVR